MTHTVQLVCDTLIILLTILCFLMFLLVLLRVIVGMSDVHEKRVIK